MDLHSLFIHSINIIASYAQRLSMMALAVFITIRIKRLEFKYLGTDTEWIFKLRLIIVFGGFAVISTHSGTIIDIEKPINLGDLLDLHSSYYFELKEKQAIISLRDTIVIMAGLVGGVYVGFGAGVIAGAERLYIGGFVGQAACAATIVLGVYAGSVRKFRPNFIFYKHPYDIIVVSFFGSIIQRVTILIINNFNHESILLFKYIEIPILILNIFGCLLFRMIERTFDTSNFEEIKRQFELQALRAQIDPHFLNNALSGMRFLIRNDPDKARDYILKLARFFDDTRKIARVNSIELSSELEQLNRYLEFQNLCLPEPVNYHEDVQKSLLSFFVPARCLLTLVENSFKYNFIKREQLNKLSINVKEKDNNIIIRVNDNGFGIEPNLLAKLGKNEIASETGGGIALYHLNRSLELAFGRKAKLEFFSELGNGTEVVITLPKRNKSWLETSAW
jgi:LytS/YehU family sensor histidine kinase